MNKLNLIKNQSGWSLVEIAVVLILMVIILLAIYMVFEISLFIYNQSTYSSLATKNVREPVNRMLREIKESNVNTVTIASNTITDPITNNGIYIVFASARKGLLEAINPGIFVTDNTTFKPLWQKYVFYYKEINTNYFRRCETVLTAPTTANLKFNDTSHVYPTGFNQDKNHYSSFITDKEATYTFDCTTNDTTNTAVISMNVSYTILKRYGGTEKEQIQIAESIKLMN